MIDDTKRMKTLHRREGNGMSFKAFLRMWASKWNPAWGPVPVGDDSYAACAHRVLASK